MIVIDELIINCDNLFYFTKIIMGRSVASKRRKRRGQKQAKKLKYASLQPLNPLTLNVQIQPSTCTVTPNTATEEINICPPSSPVQSSLGSPGTRPSPLSLLSDDSIIDEIAPQKQHLAATTDTDYLTLCYNE